MIRLAIISVTYNSSAVINEFLESLQKQDQSNWRLYIVDSASTDDTMSKINNFLDTRIVLLPQPENVGFAKGNNIGVAQAINDGCTELLLINNDTVFPTDFLVKLLRARNKYPQTVLTPKIYYPDGETIWCASGGFKPTEAYAAYHNGENELDIGQYNVDNYCDFVPMCCVLIPTKIWQQVGELDETFFIYSEDADWFYRAKSHGIKLRYCYTPTIIHKVSSLTGGAQSPTGAFYGSRNRIYFLRKHFCGIKKYYFLSLYLGGMLWKLIFRRYRICEFWWRIKGVWSGFRLSLTK